MRKLIFILLILPLVSLGQEWLEKDKQLHFAAGAGFGSLGYTVGYNVSKGKRSTAIWYGIGSSALVGTFKEVWDINGTGFDRDDLFTTILGGVISTLATDLIMSKHTYKERELILLERIKKRDKERELKQ